MKEGKKKLRCFVFVTDDSREGKRWSEMETGMVK